MEKREDSQELNSAESETEITEIGEEELDQVSGGIILIGGKPSIIASRFDKVSLNPQPLPPKIFDVGDKI
jgi:hypothetical protein